MGRHLDLIRPPDQRLPKQPSLQKSQERSFSFPAYEPSLDFELLLTHSDMQPYLGDRRQLSPTTHFDSWFEKPLDIEVS